MQQGVIARVGIFVTQCCKNPTHGPYDETGSHGFHVPEHRLGGDEDPRADDGTHDDAGATEQAQLGCRAGERRVSAAAGCSSEGRTQPSSFHPPPLPCWVQPGSPESQAPSPCAVTGRAPGCCFWGFVCVCVCVHTRSVMSKPCNPTRFLFPWDSLGKNTGVESFPPSRGSSLPRDPTQVSCIFCIGRQIAYHSATWKAPCLCGLSLLILTTTMSQLCHYHIHLQRRKQRNRKTQILPGFTARAVHRPG